jgi:DNA-nicking Smr family endonuclease
MKPSSDEDEPVAVDIPIDGTLDLHTFPPAEVGELVVEYLRECQARGIRQIRIVHGKGMGVLRRKVHAALSRMTEVSGFALANEAAGGWGATLVNLKEAPKRADGRS